MTSPDRLISPVMATSLIADLFRARERRALVIAIPADGPSFPI